MLVQTKDHDCLENLVPTLEYFVDRSCWPNWSLESARLPFHDLTWVLSGQATYWCDGIPHRVGAGDLLYLPKGSVRQASTNTDDPMHCLACNFQILSLSGAGQLNLPLPVMGHIGFADDLAELYRRLNRAWLERGPAHGLESRALLMLIIHRLVGMALPPAEGPAADSRLRIVQRHIIEHYTRPISVGQLAALVRLNPGYFGSWFRRRTGLTVHEYVNRIRVRKAADLLSTGGYNVSEAAYQSGFDDLFHFSKVFKRITGQPPSNLLRPGEPRDRPQALATVGSPG